MAGCLTRLDVSKSSMVIFFEVDGGLSNKIGQDKKIDNEVVDKEQFFEKLL